MSVVEGECGCEAGCCLGRDAAVTALVGPAIIIIAIHVLYVHHML